MNTLQELYTAFELKAGAIVGVLWGVLNLVLGGIDAPIKALCALMILDFITGVTAGWKFKELDSSVGSRGLWKKVGVFCAIGFAYCLDVAMASHMLRGMTISGFAIVEGLSVIENLDKLGVHWVIPDFLKEHLKQMAEERYKHHHHHYHNEQEVERHDR